MLAEAEPMEPTDRDDRAGGTGRPERGVLFVAGAQGAQEGQDVRLLDRARLLDSTAVQVGDVSAQVCSACCPPVHARRPGG
jgi:hypothetical protein